MATSPDEIRDIVKEQEDLLRARAGILLAEPDEQEDFHDRVTRLRADIEAETGQTLKDTAGALGEGLGTLEARAMEVFRRTDPAVAQEGVPKSGFRFTLSQMDTPEERANFLSQAVGEDGYSFDGLNNLTLTPEGQERLGLTPDPQGRDLVIDSPDFEFPEDLADLGGESGPLGGAVTGGIIGESVGGPVGSIIGAGIGAFTGSSVQEASESFRGLNLQDPQEVAKHVAKQALTGMVGDGLFNIIVKPVARYAAGPQAHRMTQEKEDLMNQALEMGVLPEASQVTNAPIAGYFRQLFNNIFGDPNQARNASAMHAKANNIRSSIDTYKRDLSDIGELVKSNIVEARQKLAVNSSAMFGRVDSIIQGEAFIPTSHLKEAAQEIARDFTRTKDGKFVLVDDVFAKQIQGIMDMPDYITSRQAQNLRSVLRAAREDNTILPGIQSYHARLLGRSVNDAIDAVSGGPSTLTPQVKSFANRVVSQTARIKDPAAKVAKIKERFEEIPLYLQAAAAPELKRMTGVDITPSSRAINAARAARQLKLANDTYRESVKDFDNSIVQRLVRDPKFGGSVDPELVVSSVFRRGRSSDIKRLRKVIQPGTFRQIQAAAMDEILHKMTKSTDDPFISLFNGKQFVDTLDSFGKETLTEMFGRAKVKELYDLGNTMKLVTKGQGGGAGKIVAAGIVAHPLANVGRLVRFMTMRSLLNNPAALRWLTTGIKDKNTREGAKALFRFGVQAMQFANQHTRELKAGRNRIEAFREQGSALLNTPPSPNPAPAP